MKVSAQIGKLVFVALLVSAYSTYGQKSNSVLSTGDWYKIAVLQNGVYKIDYNFLSSMGVNVDDLNPKLLAVYGNANNGMLPQVSGDARADDLIENSIEVVGEDDGKFNTDDYLIFYGRGPDKVAYDGLLQNYEYEKNLYSDTAFYFLTIKSSEGLRVAENSTNFTGTTTDSYRSISYHEVDEISRINSGRRWFGELFHSGNLTNKLTFPSQGIISGSTAEVRVQLLSTSKSASSYDVTLNNESLGEIKMTKVAAVSLNPQGYTWEADVQQETFQHTLGDLSNANGLTLAMTYHQTLSTDNGFLDFAVITSEKELNLQHGILEWYMRPDEEGYAVTGANTSTRIWDISSHTTHESMMLSVEGSVARFSVTDQMSQMLAFNEEHLIVPVFDRQIENQNLHELSSLDGIIITHKNFTESATRLSNFRMQNDGLILEVVTVDQIYNEYSSGALDISAIRDFVKHQRNKNPSTFKYVLLFGDCSFDYKFRGIYKTNYNFVPIYQSRESRHRILSYGSDDYIGFLDVDEGYWEETDDISGDHILDIGIGRIPIRTDEEGQAIVNKLIRYDTSPLRFGTWRNNMVFVADDGDTNLHQNDAEKMALIVDNNRKEFRVDKLYLDAYVQESNRSPDASKALIDQISYGNLFVNYTGHGNTTILAGEYLFTESMIEELSNNIKMPFFVTATCDFGKYDDVTEVTGGEQLFLLPYGGAIGLLTSTRKVYANTNLEINRAFYDAAFEKENNKFKRLGDIIKETKNNSLSGYNNRNYGLLGDPSMHLAFPDYEMKITHINDELVGTADTLKALGIYKVKGAIFNEDQVMDSFTGEATVTVLDKPDKFITLDEDNADVYDINNVILFNGKAQVVNGQFEISILIPKNINYAFGSGKVYLYAVNSTKMMDAHGSFTDAIIGGSVQQEVKDRQGPEITLLINDSTFTSGQSVGVNSLFIAKIKDESGVNLSSLGFSNQLMLSIDDEEPFLVSKYYTSELDTYEEGTILFPLEDLSEGKHSIYLEASDVFNNESNASIEFVVSENNVLPLLNVVNYPNPLTSKDDEMTIAFNHDRIGEDLIVDFEIINMQGREILANQYRFDNVAEERLYLKWDLLSNSKGRLDAGLYFYRLKVKSNLDGTSNELYNKILILK